jgi:hypothetical protein
MRYTLCPGQGLRLNLRRVQLVGCRTASEDDVPGGSDTSLLNGEMLEYVKSTTQIIIRVRELPNEAPKFDLYRSPGRNRFKANVHV